jgi:hypothetical protein
LVAIFGLLFVVRRRAEDKHLMQVRQYLFMRLHQILVRVEGVERVRYRAAVGQLRISVQPAVEADFEAAEELLERLDLPDEALENLCRLARLDEETFRVPDGWSARVELDRTPLLVRARQDRWTIYGAEDGMEAARRLHGLIGVSAEGWDLDR